jgi:outer membrane receptor protein involved in Fe transport
MVYARIASGYQAGGPNSLAPGASASSTFGPSTTNNFELGWKDQLAGGLLSVDASVFYVQWSRIQLLGLAPVSGLSYVFNGGRARSQGLELAAELKPMDGLTIRGNATYTDAILTNTAGNGYPGVAGDPLPYSSKYNGELAVDDRFPLVSSLSGFVGASVSCVGRRYEPFPPGGQSQVSIPSYAYGSLRAGVVGAHYTVSAYVKNITNERGILSANQFPVSGTPAAGIWHTSLITPRTVGLSVSTSF